MEYIFWFVFFIIAYTFLGYGVVAYMLVRIKGARSRPAGISSDDALPALTLVIPAYNELDCLPAKVENSLSLLYPSAKYSILFVTEGSTDGSDAYLMGVPEVEVMGGMERRGKIEAINRAMRQIDTPIVVFTDANTLLNPEALLNIVRHYADPAVAAVAGEKRVLSLESDAAAGAGEGIYWKYESFLKKLDTDLQTVVGAAGELFSMRTSLYQPVEPDTILDDFMISLRLAAQEYRVVYEPEAFALEDPSYSVQEELKRKVRIAAGGFQSIVRLRYLLNPLRYGLLSFQYVSHRVLRWAVTPFCLPLLLFLNFGLWQTEDMYKALLLGQLTFYGMATVGMLLENRKVKVKLFFIPFYFCFMNYAVWLGLFRYLRGGQSGVWEKVKRAGASAGN
ncbi:glycosyltransferase family 2 protein [Pontibacter oryzae]|uniref:Glycosyltransferase family 2 protein n=1 Tax=Pontibacter oryzae TaxID=2304593 RepID=A0A399SG01_9BACT|nr:glycosyltransferase family 2 protein [Pontibacter oryzae]RIJ42520.1 glycosyltransferase family 2 protein [Pontibacter oryzae]